MSVPIAFGGALLLALLLLGINIYIGGTASGQRLQIQLEGSCVAEALPIIQARATTIGLGDPVFQEDGMSLTVEATMPGLEDDAVAMPRILSRSATLEILGGDAVLATHADLETSELDLDENGMAYSGLTFTEDTTAKLRAYIQDQPQDYLVVMLDGDVVARRPNTIALEEEFRVLMEAALPAERMRNAADITILLTHGQIPCEMSVRGVSAVSEAG